MNGCQSINSKGFFNEIFILFANSYAIKITY